MNPDRRRLDELRIDRVAAPRGRPYGVLALIVLLIVSAGAGASWAARSLRR